jgi:hypothetical protein
VPALGQNCTPIATLAKYLNFLDKWLHKLPKKRSVPIATVDSYLGIQTPVTVTHASTQSSGGYSTQRRQRKRLKYQLKL